ncbi:MAG: hypothetical protein SXQ77_07665, partial [Halobacteria archaeon]|nr:hypothetical protein [Halobacteria archaeon]
HTEAETSIDSRDSFAEFIKEKAGDSLRALAFYDFDSYEIAYIREDVRKKYPEDTTDQIHREHVLNNLNKEYFEDLFEAGNLGGTLHRFENAVIVRVIQEEGESVFISLDRENELNVVKVMDECIEKMDY